MIAINLDITREYRQRSGSFILAHINRTIIIRFFSKPSEEDRETGPNRPVFPALMTIFLCKCGTDSVSDLCGPSASTGRPYNCFEQGQNGLLFLFPAIFQATVCGRSGSLSETQTRGEKLLWQCRWCVRNEN